MSAGLRGGRVCEFFARRAGAMSKSARKDAFKWGRMDAYTICVLTCRFQSICGANEICERNNGPTGWFSALP